jgi:hypothetical protein
MMGPVAADATKLVTGLGVPNGFALAKALK